MTRNSTHLQRGGIVVETAIILVVILLLVLISIPVYRGGPEDARTAQAERDVLVLGKAQERVGQALGYYVPLQLLDNVELRNEASALKLVPRDVADSEAAGDQPELARVEDAAEKWTGPYAETKRVYLGEAGQDMDLSLITAESVLRDYPLDPWGQPYRFYSPIGVVGSKAAETATGSIDDDAFSDGALTTIDDRFESFAIVSYGPDGESDSVTDQSDDIIYLFESQEDGSAEPEA